jgi:hypothetical protein
MALQAPWDFRAPQVIPQPINPLDKTTIFSVYPKDIVERKITVFPGFFEIPKGTPDAPSKLVVGASSWWKDIPESHQLLEIPIHSVMMANSIINDYMQGMLGASLESGPGLFFLNGDLDLAKAQKDFPDVFKNAVERQKRWFLNLVNIADTLWARTNGNPMAINDDMRLAARYLGRDDREWLANFQAVQNTRCAACGTMRNPAFPVCATCGAITDVKKAAELGIKFQTDK